MTTVLQLVRTLTERPHQAAPAGLRLRTFAGPADIDPWLALRDRAFARQSLGVRSWSAGDFAEEFLEKPWWRPEHLWLAEEVSPGLVATSMVGSITLALRGDGPSARPVVHWLMVDPRFRRRGLGQWLLATLEARGWDLGYRAVWLETHAAWRAAAAMYEQAGYRPIGGAAADPG